MNNNYKMFELNNTYYLFIENEAYEITIRFY